MVRGMPCLNQEIIPHQLLSGLRMMSAFQEVAPPVDLQKHLHHYQQLETFAVNQTKAVGASLGGNL